MARLLAALCLLMLSGRGTGRSYRDVLLPRPRLMRLTDGYARLSRGMSRRFRQVDSISGARDYALPGYPNEAYSLRVTRDSIVVCYVTERGRLRALQTLEQLREGAGGKEIPCCEVTDWPAFKVRGWMHDVGRSYISVEELCREIELLARFKVNTFHWHLTENQAWRFQVGAFPQLTADTTMTRLAGRFYTRQECREVEAFAALRGITVIPEVDMPGHSAAFERAMGHPMQSAEGRRELRVILGELMDAFPLAPYIHIGGDETEVSADFLQEMADVVREGGKGVVVWNPIRGKISPTFCDITQLWSTAGRAIPGIPAIDCRYSYANHFDVFADLVGLWRSNIYYSREGNSQVAGMVTAFWNDRRLEGEGDILRQNNFYANVLACAERAWCGGGERYIEEGGTRLPNEGPEYEAFADWERRFLYHKDHSLRHEDIPYVRQSNVRWRIMPSGADSESLRKGGEVQGAGSESLSKGGEACAADSASLWTGGGIYLAHTWHPVVPSGYSGGGEGAVAWTYVFSPRAQEAGALIEFHNYGRSERDKAPDRGRWDRMGSRIWLNDEELVPPEWTRAGEMVSLEDAMGNENFTARPPYRIHLKKGWNKVLIGLPHRHPDGIRKPKWMFTFVITDRKGCHALQGLRYNPDALPRPTLY